MWNINNFDRAISAWLYLNDSFDQRVVSCISYRWDENFQIEQRVFDPGIYGVAIRFHYVIVDEFESRVWCVKSD